MEGLSSPKPLLEQKLPTLASVRHCCGKQAYCFLAALSATSFTLLSFLSSVLWPHCSLLYISPCFGLLFLYTLNPRQSVLTRVFALFPGEHLYPFCSLPRGFFNASTGASQPAANFPLLQPSEKLIATDWEPDWTQLNISPLDIPGGCCHAPHTMAQFLSLWWGWQGGLAQKVQTNLASFTTVFFPP